MVKLIGYLKPFTWVIVLIFLLLFGQAMTDLSLPDYMSKIVNVGIQQHGIVDPSPQVIRASEMKKVLLFVDQSGKDAITADYQLLSSDKLSAEAYAVELKNYPILSSEPVYKLINTSKAEIQKLNAVFAKSLMLVSIIESNGLTGLPDGQTLPAGTDAFKFLATLPETQLTGMRQIIDQQSSSIPANMVTQSAIGYLGTEYKMIGVNLSQQQTNYIVKIGGIMLLLTLLGTALSVWVGFLSARIAATFARDTRRKLFTKVENFSNVEFDKFSTASLITRTTNDIQQIQMVLVMLLRIVFYAPIIGVGGIIKALGQDLSMSWIIVAAVCALLTMITIVFLVAVPKFRLIQQMVDKLNLVTREMLTGIMVVRAFNTQKHEEKRFDKANQDLTQLNLFINRVMVFLMPAMMLLMNGAMLMVIWFGAHQVDAGNMQVGNMMAFMQYTMQIIMAFLMVSMIFIMLPRATVSAQRISEVIETKLSINDPQQPKKFDGNVRGEMEFQHVSFKYPGAEDYVLCDVSFSARPGHTVAIVGGTGSGKSTLVNLIPRFYDVTEGRILVDQIDVRDVSQHDLRDKIGYIPQKTILFSGSIESNLKYADEQASQSDIEKAAEIAQSTDFIKASEKGYATDISQGGMNLSGGQKQRLSIARALVKKPEIFIFDDSFSAVDYKTDVALRRALKTETERATVLIVAQRISTIMSADYIVVLEEGKIVGKGNHRELMESCEVYRELALSQLSKEELA
jgi:ATP-binding cassette subfamily B multidrug efflux pump